MADIGQNIDVKPLREQWLTIWKQIQSYWTLNYTKQKEIKEKLIYQIPERVLAQKLPLIDG